MEEGDDNKPEPPPNEPSNEEQPVIKPENAKEQLPTQKTTDLAASTPAPKRRGGRVNLNRGPLTEKEECPDCKKVLSKHSLIYNTHKCPAKARKSIVIENIEAPSLGKAAKSVLDEAPVAKATPTHKQPPQISQPKLPKNYIDLDGDIDYSHLNVHSIIDGFFNFTRAKEK